MALFAGCQFGLFAQPSVINTVPANGASGVATSTTVVFTFNTAMDPDLTAAVFYDGFNFFNTSDEWSAGNTVLSCTPLPGFTANATINWYVDGESAGGDQLFPTFGSFSTGTAGSGGSGTNATTSFSVGKIHHYFQTSAGAPTLDPLKAYGFSGVTSLASNRTANAVDLTLPTGAVSNLTHYPPPAADIFIMAPSTDNLASYEATFPAGNYSFFVQAQTSNQTVVVALPTTNSMPHPNVPHLTNYVAAQTVNPSQPFVLGWDAFTGGAATNYIDVDIDGAITSPEPGQPGWLNGTARTFTIPAGTLLPNTTYAARIGFLRHFGTTNASYTTAAYRATYTEFSLATTGGGTGSLVLTNAKSTPANFSFDVLCPVGLPVTVEYKTNLSSVVWHTLLVTNDPPSRFHAVAPQSTTNRHLFFRARIGS